MTSKVTVLIADDEALVRSGLRMLLEPQPDLEVVGEAKDGSEAVDLARKTRPRVLLMDVRMPKKNGLEALQELGDLLGDPTRVLMLTTFDLDEYVYRALRLGASGFLLKDTPPEQLINAVQVIASGEGLLAPSVTRRLIDEFAQQQPRDEQMTGRLNLLTDRERETFELLARGLSTSEMAERLFVSEATIKTHVARALTKLGLRDRVQAVVFGYESGLVKPGADT